MGGKCASFYVLVFLFSPALCGAITYIDMNNVSIHPIMLMFISGNLASEFSLSVAGKVFSGANW